MPAKKKTTKKSAKKPIVSKKTQEEIKVEGAKVVSKVKDLIREGNVRQITVKNNRGKVVFTLPVTAGVIGAVLLPPLAVLGTLAAVLTDCTITVKRK